VAFYPAIHSCCGILRLNYPAVCFFIIQSEKERSRRRRTLRVFERASAGFAG
jgi:hypothetical protein